ncbi:MAG: hypothetical protein Q4D05_08650 [Acinetobacter sp.]|nr:hypothetical protein [Acinetobacter sp.]
MNFNLSFDHINQMHWKTLKSVIAALSLVPASYAFHQLWFFSNDSEQMVIRFFALSLLSAWIIIAFCAALHTDASVSKKIAQSQQTLSRGEQWILHLYRQIPYISLTICLLFVQTQWC